MSDLQSRIEFALRDAGFSNREAATLAKRAAAVPDRERVAISWADFWMDKGDMKTANDFAAFEKAEAWRLANIAAMGEP